MASESCVELLEKGKTLEPNPDVAGLGVILAFLISAYVVLVWAFFCYLFGLLPNTIIGRVDQKCFRVNSRRSEDPKWRDALHQITLIFSDQQIITGIAILLAGYGNLQTVSIYHWQFVIYLAWMSSNVHLTTLSLLGQWLHDNSVLRTWRMFGMIALFLLLIVSLIPTLAPPSNWQYIYKWRHKGGVPVRCFMPGVSDLAPNIDIDTAFSIAIIIISYLWKVGQLHPQSNRFFSRWFRLWPEWLLERAAARELREPQFWKFGSKVRYRIIVLVYMTLVSWFEFIESFAASLYLLTLGLIWGTIQIQLPRANVSPDVIKQESTWGFGQILPLSFLLQPAAAVLEMYYSKNYPAQTHEETLPENEDKKTLLVSHSPMLPQPTKLSEIFQHYTPRTPKEKADKDGPRPEIEVLYRSKFFVSVIWLYQLGILGIAGSTYAFANLSSINNIWLTTCTAIAALVGLLIFYLPLGMFFSKIFR